MSGNRRRVLFVGWLLTACSASSYVSNKSELYNVSDRFEHDFSVDSADLSPTGSNPYFDLRPGAILVLDGPERITITVLEETQRIQGVDTRVVEERKTIKDWPLEVDRIYLAISTSTGDIYCFGKDVTFNGNTIVSHFGTWVAGEHEARVGLYLPATPVLGRRFQRELAPGVSLQRCEVVATDAVVETPAGRFTGCMQLEVTRPDHPEEVRTMVYARGTGIVSEKIVWIGVQNNLSAQPKELREFLGDPNPSPYRLVSRTPPYGGR